MRNVKKYLAVSAKLNARGIHCRCCTVGGSKRDAKRIMQRAFRRIAKMLLRREVS